MFERLEGEHIVLRKAKESDYKSMLRNVWGDPEVYQWMLFQPTLMEEDAIERCQRTIEFQKDHYAYLVAEKETDEAIGFCGIKEISPGHFEESGIGIGTKCQGKGYGKEVVALLLDLAFRKLGAVDFTYGYFQDNTKSRKVAEHFGFAYDHTYEMTRPWDGAVKIVDSCILTREKYKMQRIMVIGSPGAGKSTFARKLRDKTGLPLYYMDMLFHKPDKTTVTREELDQRLQEILQTDSWIIDGNYQRTLPMRFEACTDVIILDYPLEQCLKGAEARIGMKREDMPWIEQEFEPEFRQYILDFPKEQLPRIYELVEQYRETKNITIFRSREEADEWLEENNE